MASEESMTSQETEAEKWFNFSHDLKQWDIMSYHDRSASDVKSKFLDLKKDNYYVLQKIKPGDIKIGLRDWNHEILGILLESFFLFHKNNIIWETGLIELDSSNARFVGPFLHALNTMPVFKKLTIKLGDFYEEDDICPGILSNTFTEIEIERAGKMSWGANLAFNKLLESNPPCLKVLAMFLPEQEEDFDCRMMLSALINNRTLKNIHFMFLGRGAYTDANTSEIIAAVARIPTLETFQMTYYDQNQNNVLGELSSEALKRMLSDSTSLRELQFSIYAESFPNYYPFANSNNDILNLNMECIIQGLKNSRSLKRLDIRAVLYGDLLFARLFRVLPDCPWLELIGLRHLPGGVVTSEDLDQVKLLPRLPRPIQLYVETTPSYSDYSDEFSDYEDESTSYDTEEYQREMLEELLRYHPEVRLSLRDYDNYVEDENTYRFSEGMTKFWYIVNMNWHGRYLLDRPKVPLSIWPLVLEKVNDNDHVKDKASILYGLLKGPAVRPGLVD